MPSFDKEVMRVRLSKSLPGIEAQMEMMPKVAGLDRFDLSKRSKATPGGVLILIYPHDGELYLPLMLRPEYGGAHSGQVSFPGQGTGSGPETMKRSVPSAGTPLRM